MIKCNVSNVAIEITETETLTAGRVGLECQFTFSSEWDGLAKVAYFLGSTTSGVVITEDTVTVPAGPLAEAGYKFYVGVVGKNAAGDVVIPTLWAKVGKIQRSAAEGDESQPEPDPDVVAQIQLMAMDAVEKATYAKGVIDDNLEAITEAGETQVGAVQAKGEEVLESIPEDYTALSGEVDDLKSALFAENAVASADLTSLSRSINPSNKWTTLSGATTGYIAIPSNAEKIVITPKSGVTNVWAFLNSIGTPITGETPDFSTSYPGRISGNTSTPRTYSVEPDMHFIYFIQTNTSGVDVFPSSVSIQTIQLIDDTLSIPGKAADAKVTGDRFASVEDTLDKFFETSAHDFSGDEQLAWTILRSNNTWFAGGTARAYVINAGGAVSVDIQASAAGNCVFAALKSFRPVIGDPVDYAGDTTAVRTQAGNSYHAEIPADAGYLYFSAISSDGVDVTPTVQITTKAAGGNVYNYYNSNTLTNNVTQNTYNVTTTPDLSAETLYYLPPTGDATDRSADIAALLAADGICRLGSGTYYVASIDMPNGSAIEGVGASTVLRLIDNVSGYALRMRSRCKVRNLRILGSESYSALKPAAATPGDRIGVLWEGILNGDGNTYTYPGLSMISGVWFERIQGSGLKCLNTSSGTRNKLLVSDCYYLYCDAGVNIASVSEFMQFANCTFNSCYYGVINNGGNNTFANCDFAVCAQCFVINNSTGALENPGHSCMVNCDFSHAIKVNSDGTLTSNQGDFIYLAGTGYEFNGCQFGFGHINFTDAEGVLCVGCVWSGRSDNDIYITNGTGIFFVGCLFGAQYSFNVVNNTKTKLINCYTKAGDAVLL